VGKGALTQHCYGYVKDEHSPLFPWQRAHLS
jgi:hypothetical protein